MKKLEKYLFICLLLCNFEALAQKITVSGFVTDSDSRERLIGVSIMESKNRQQTISNEYGFFTISLPKQDSVSIEVRFIGYEKSSWKGILQNDTLISFALTSGNFDLKTVEIKSRKNPSEEGSKMSLPMSVIKELPSLAGQTDVMRSFQLLPGISGGSEGSTGLHIRGGSSDQNLVLMDDVPLYYVNHLGGFLSIFNAEAIQSVQVYKGNPPTRFGGRLSGVTDVRLREGNSNKHKVALEMGLISTSILFEGPLTKKKKSTYLLSLRRFNYDFILQSVNLFRQKGYKTPYFTFSDINAKFTHVLSDKDRISLSIFSGSDRFINRPGELKSFNSIENNKFKLAWGNKMAALRWSHVWGPRLFSNVTFSLSEFRYGSDQYGYSARFSSFGGSPAMPLFEIEQSLTFTSRIKDAMLRLDQNWSPLSKVSVHFGAVITQHWFEPNVTAYKNTSPQVPADTVLNASTLAVLEPALYAEIIYKPTNALHFSAGLHWAAYKLQQKTFSMSQPQAAISYVVNKKLSFNASANARYQGIHLLTGNGLGLPVDLWLPATTKAPPQRSAQIAMGGRYNIPSKQEWVLHSDIFFKKFSQQIDFQEGASFFTGSQEWEDKIENKGIGQSYGLELLLEKNIGRLTGWLSYTWSKNSRQFSGINNGNSYPYPYDRRHNTAIVMQYKLNKRIKLSMDWVFSTGIPVTLPAAVYPSIQPGYLNGAYGLLPGIYFLNALQYNQRNKYRMPNYHRLDFAVQFLKQKRNGERTWSFGAYNTYNQLNPFYLYYGFERSSNTYKLYKYTLFPVIPSISWKRSFTFQKKK
jgi:hypothetical protein